MLCKEPHFIAIRTDKYLNLYSENEELAKEIQEMFVNDDDAYSALTALVYRDTYFNSSEREKVINKFVKEFEKQGYHESVLVAETQYEIRIYEEEYSVSITISVYPADQKEIAKKYTLLQNEFFKYVHSNYTALRNEYGYALKKKLAKYFKLIELAEECVELKKKLERAQDTIKDQEEYIEELQEMLAKRERRKRRH